MLKHSDTLQLGISAIGLVALTFCFIALAFCL
jgi:hypothetical protein